MLSENSKSGGSQVQQAFTDKVRETILAHGMIGKGESVLVAVSGGADSVALTHVLVSLASELSIRLALAHLNHGLRPQEAERDADFVAALADELDLPCHIDTVDVRSFQQQHKLSLEDAARRVRHRFLQTTAERHAYSKIALGHHADDNAELILMFLLRGSGSAGLAGIPALREGVFIRPLIRTRRAEILHYLHAAGRHYVTDATNMDLRYLRNRVRHQLIPMLRAAYNPKIVEALNRLASIIVAENQWMEELVDPLMATSTICREPEQVVLSLSALASLPLAARRRIVRRAICGLKGDLRRITLAHVDQILKLAECPVPDKRLNLPQHIEVWKQLDTLIVLQRPGAAQKGPERHRAELPWAAYEYRLSLPDTLRISEIDAILRITEITPEQVPKLTLVGSHTAYFDLDQLHFPLVVRNFRAGDHFSPLGTSGRQKLKKFFIDHKVERAERRNCPILVSRGQIVWIAGHRVGHAARIRDETRRVLKAELIYEARKDA
jgi:tRNA(Ile)-lysidine synthase